MKDFSKKGPRRERLGKILKRSFSNGTQGVKTRVRHYNNPNVISLSYLILYYIFIITIIITSNSL